ncbi:hypothetical protein GCM10028803_03170 [Larkinella knui]|uniref:Uncharacterized protein n=1 Tax=Larkinella knui TaxID=2025310 RepID=A0A3P1CKY4_9BACT|nr:hypothetical protein [Larkinella knui]RRB13991.1 hypothetical protein EHT87_17220 [Larkinella knui]
MINNSNENILLDDANSPDVNRKLMSAVSTDFVKVSDTLREASYVIRKRGFTENPIFVASRRAVDIGQLLLGPNELAGNAWTYRASLLDEFVQRKLVAEESVDLFRESYKNPDEYCCLFVIEGDFAGFIFIPFPED